jgi:hypothetical protein
MNYLDPTRLTSLRRRNIGRRPLDTSRLTSLRRNADDRSLPRRRNLSPFSVSTTNRARYRSNPDKNWGPTLYNPLEDRDHAFKDDSHYQRTIAKLRRNPMPNHDFCPDCGLRKNPDVLNEDDDSDWRQARERYSPGIKVDFPRGMYPELDEDDSVEGDTLYMWDRDGSRRARNPDYGLRAVTGTNSVTGSPGQGLFRSLFARRNPTASIETASNSLIGQGLFKSIFSRKRNPMNQWKQPRPRHHRRWGSRRFDKSSFYGV